MTVGEAFILVDVLPMILVLVLTIVYSERKIGKSEEREVISMYECFHCGMKKVIWQNDYSFDDMGYEGEGIVHVCTCSNCGAEIEYRISLEGEEDE